MGKQALANLLSQPKYFSRAMSNRFHDAFDYYIPFLISGEGELMYPSGLLPKEKKAYTESIKAQRRILNEGMDLAEIIGPTPPEIKEEEEYYRSIDIDKYVETEVWDTNEDFNKALMICDIFNVQVQDIMLELDLSEKHCRELREEIKRLNLENTGLKRKIKALSSTEKSNDGIQGIQEKKD